MQGTFHRLRPHGVSLHNSMCDDGEHLILTLPPDIDENDVRNRACKFCWRRGEEFHKHNCWFCRPVDGDKPSAVAKKRASQKSVSFGVMLTSRANQVGLSDATST